MHVYMCVYMFEDLYPHFISIMNQLSLYCNIREVDLKPFCPRLRLGCSSPRLLSLTFRESGANMHKVDRTRVVEPLARPDIYVYMYIYIYMRGSGLLFSHGQLKKARLPPVS